MTIQDLKSRFRELPPPTFVGSGFVRLSCRLTGQTHALYTFYGFTFIIWDLRYFTYQRTISLIDYYVKEILVGTTPYIYFSRFVVNIILQNTLKFKYFRVFSAIPFTTDFVGRGFFAELL